MDELLDTEFIELVINFLESSKKIRDAAKLCDGDPIKQEMIQDIIKEFTEASARSAALQAMVEEKYPQNREFILSELKDLTSSNEKIAQKIETKLTPLIWN